MKDYKFLPKQAYSISDAVKYISLNYNINISERDLIGYIQTGELNASIYLDGTLNKIESINKKELSSNMILNVRSKEIFLQFNKNEINAKINHIRDCEIFRIDINNIYFDLIIILNDSFYIDDYFENNNQINLYSGELDKFQNIIFNGYFPVSNLILNRYNTDELIEAGGIDEFPDIRMDIDDDFYIHIPIYENRTGIRLEDLYILHKDIISFLEFFSIIDSEDNQDEIQRLRNKLDLKNNQIEELSPALEKLKDELSKKDQIIEDLQKQINKKASTASDNKKNAFIKSLLYIHYGNEVAENPRPHIYDPNSGDKGMSGCIQVDFDRNGLAKHLPTGKTINGWVKTIELDIS
ncbi:TPA: FlxA-like family protein [Pasteurella multocida]|nr:FlxA-like family protein [Pasteurella multocida]